MKKNNIFIVEGKADSVKLKSIFSDIKTIETNGLRIKKEIINTILKLKEENIIYIFTDPDYAGFKIRNRLNKILNNDCINIYLKNNNKNRKNGLAEANVNDIKTAIKNSQIQFNINANKQKLTFEEYLNLNLNSKNKRKYLADKLNISYFNHKNFYKILNYLNITYEEVKLYLEDYNKKDN